VFHFKAEMILDSKSPCKLFTFTFFQRQTRSNATFRVRSKTTFVGKKKVKKFTFLWYIPKTLFFLNIY
jgi:hypothetical protein